MALANQEAQRFNHESIGTEHILLGFVKEGSGVGANALKNLDVDLKKVRIETEKPLKSGPDLVTMGKLPQTPRAKKVIEYAIEEARNLGHNYVGTEHLLLGMLREHDGIAGQVLLGLGLKLEAAREEVLNILDAGATDEAPQPSGNKKGQTPALDTFGRDLTTLARMGNLDPTIGCDKEIDRVVEVLCLREANNAIILNDSSVIRNGIVEGIAQLIAQGNVPHSLSDRRLISLDLSKLVAGTQNRTQVDNRITTILDEVRKAKDVVLYFDEIHVLLDADADDEIGDVAHLLRPALRKGDIQCIAATTWDYYQANLTKDAAFRRRFQIVVAAPPTAENSVELLKAQRDRFEAHHRVQILDSALEEAVDLCKLFIPDGVLPDKAINVIDQAGSFVRRKQLGKPPELKELEEEIERLSIQKDELIKNADYEEAAKRRDEAEGLRGQREEMRKQWRLAARDADGVVDEDSICETIAQMTGISIERIRERDASHLSQRAPAIMPGLPAFERLQSDSVLQGEEIQITPGLGFVLLPHNDEFRDLFTHVITYAMEQNNLKAVKAEDISQPGAILPQVWRQIRSAQVIVADVTGKNANVIFELGLCYGLHRCPIMLVRDPAELPFNLRSLRYIQYKPDIAGAEELKGKLTAAIHEFLASSSSIVG